MKKVFLSIFMIALALISYSQLLALQEDFYNKIIEKSSQNKTIVSEFTKLRKAKNIKRLIESKGDFYYDNSGKMALIYKEPKGHKILIDNDDFIIVNEDEKVKVSGSENPILSQISYMLKACMKGDISKFALGWDMLIKDNEDIYVVELKPKENSEISDYINSIKMVFEKNNMTLIELKIIESSKAYTKYEFFNKQINANFDMSIFTE